MAQAKKSKIEAKSGPFARTVPPPQPGQESWQSLSENDFCKGLDITKNFLSQGAKFVQEQILIIVRAAIHYAKWK
jgi:hypothetical protein